MSFLLIVLFALVLSGIVIDVVRVCLTTTINVVLVSTLRVILGLVFISFELTALVLKVTWLFAVVASWFGFSWVLLCGLLRHSVYLQFIWGFQTIQFQLSLKI